MRFLHIADLHLGKQMNDLLLLDDQEAVLDQIIHIANDALEQQSSIDDQQLQLDRARKAQQICVLLLELLFPEIVYTQKPARCSAL